MKRAFVVSPIGEPGSGTRSRADQILNHLIRPVTSELGYEAVRADEIAAPGLITCQVISCLVARDMGVRPTQLTDTFL